VTRISVCRKKKRSRNRHAVASSITGSVTPRIWSLYQISCWLRRSLQPAFFVRSAEVIPCPCCGGSLVVAGSRGRVWYRSSGERAKLILRRLYCEPCARIHHELPDLLVPYKRYDAESIEGILAEPVASAVAVDESTIARWLAWFQVWSVYAAATLQAISIRFHLPVEQVSVAPQSALHSFGRYVGDAAGWLGRVVRPIANSNLWVTDPFCLSVR